MLSKLSKLVLSLVGKETTEKAKKNYSKKIISLSNEEKRQKKGNTL